MHSCDVTIIGGGLIGCASAYYLSKMGARVSVVEKGQLNQGASGRNAGSLHFQLEYRLIKHQDQLGEQLAFLIPFTQIAVAQWQQLEQELEQDLELVMHGGLMVSETAEQVAVLEEKCTFENKHGLAVELLSGNEVRELAPYISENIQAALLCPQEGHCNPRFLTLAYARAAKKLGAEFFTQTRVTDVGPTGENWRVLAQQHQPESNTEQFLCIESAAVLNAGGAWAGELAAMAGVHFPLFPVALSMNITEEAPPVINHMIQHVGRKLSMKQVRDGNVLIGGGWSARIGRDKNGWLPDRTKVPRQSIQGNLAAAAAVVPHIGGLHLLRTWSGTTAVTTDQLPIIGEVSQKPGFYVAAGGSGFTFGPTYAKLISELILTNETSYPLDPFSPERFDHINMFMR